MGRLKQKETSTFIPLRGKVVKTHLAAGSPRGAGHEKELLGYKLRGIISHRTSWLAGTQACAWDSLPAGESGQQRHRSGAGDGDGDDGGSGPHVCQGRAWPRGRFLWEVSLWRRLWHWLCTHSWPMGTSGGRAGRAAVPARAAHGWARAGTG